MDICATFSDDHSSASEQQYGGDPSIGVPCILKRRCLAAVKRREVSLLLQTLGMLRFNVRVHQLERKEPHRQ